MAFGAIEDEMSGDDAHLSSAFLLDAAACRALLLLLRAIDVESALYLSTQDLNSHQSPLTLFFSHSKNSSSRSKKKKKKTGVRLTVRAQDGAAAPAAPKPQIGPKRGSTVSVV